MNYNNIKFIGGGRWATTVLNELAYTFPKKEILWTTDSNTIERSKLLDNIHLINYKKDKTLANKTIIASHSTHHCKDLSLYDSGTNHLLIEKPLFPTITKFERLSSFDKKRISFNLEFYNAYFINDFYQRIKNTKINTIKVIWNDPLTEYRTLQEIKYSEVYSSIFMDQLLHVASILKKMKINFDNITNIKTKYDNNGVLKIYCKNNTTSMIISLSRFANKRKRKILINKNEFELDFKGNPWVKEKSSQIEEIKLSNRMKPIAKTLKSFINSSNNKPSPLSIFSLMPEIRFCFNCEENFMENIHNKLLNHNKNSIPDTVKLPIFIYYIAILYYQNLDTLNNKKIVYLKGNDGVYSLIKWWKKNHKKLILNGINS